MNSFLGRKILVITAHPDDESYVAAGTIYKNYLKKGKTALFCASYGEKGKSHVKKYIIQASLKLIRKRELFKAAKLLHIKPICILGVPDGKLKHCQARMYKAGLSFAKRIKPEVVLSFGPDGISGHLDHVAVGKVAKRIARELKIPFFAFSLPQKIQQNAIEYLKTRRQSQNYLSKIKYRKPEIKVSINMNIKKMALEFHKSQMDGNNAFTGFPKIVVKELLKAEYYIK